MCIRDRTTPPPGAPAGALSRRSFEVLGGLGQLFRSVESPPPGRAAFNAVGGQVGVP